MLDATGTECAAIVGLSMGGQRGLLLAASHPERVSAAVFIGPAVPLAEGRMSFAFDEELGTDEGWAKYNAHYWRRDYRGFLEFFFSQVFTEPHSTKQIEDCVGWGLETDAETLIASHLGPAIPDRYAALEVCSRIRCPVLVIHGDEDAIVPHKRGRLLAEATGGQLLTIEGGGHCVQARDPVKAAGEIVHPASQLQAGESAHIEARMGEHRLHVFQAWREMDELFVSNFMLFHDAVRDDRYDLWLGDEAWELDYYLHENPELKTAPYVFLTDFVGWLPVGERDASIAADYNAENIELVERYPYVRDGAVFIGEQEDVIPREFGPGLPQIPDWVRRHFDFSGYVLPFDPADFADTERLRSELGLDPARPLVVASVGGSGVGVHLLRRIAAGFEELRRDVPEAELLLVCGPRIDPNEIEPVEGMRAVGYVHDLFRTLACCDLAVVQGGLTTTMELVANRRPMIYVPLRDHFEQNHHNVHRLQRYGAPPPTPYEETSPARLAELMRERLGAPVDYLPVEAGGAARAAELILAATA